MLPALWHWFPDVTYIRLHGIRGVLNQWQVPLETDRGSPDPGSVVPATRRPETNENGSSHGANRMPAVPEAQGQGTVKRTFRILSDSDSMPMVCSAIARFAQHNRPIGEGVIVHRNLQSSVIDLLLYSGTNPKKHPYDTESSNQQNIFVPAWAMMTGSNFPEVTKMRQAINSVYDEATEMTKNGASVEAVAGIYPNIAALFDERQFATSPIITQWAARMVRSIKLKCTLYLPRSCGIRMLRVWQRTTSLPSHPCTSSGTSCVGWYPHLRRHTRGFQSG